MHIKYNTAVLQSIIKDISILTGISISFLDTQYNTLANVSPKNDYCSFLHLKEEICSRCTLCDKAILQKCFESKKLEKHICHAGLYDAAMPIIKNDTPVGYIIFGRIRSVLSPKKSKYQTNPNLVKLYDYIPCFTEDKLNCFYDLLPQILFNNAIEFENDNLIEIISGFINENLSVDLSIDFLCNKFKISKNSLYTLFKETYNKTVNEYITDCRIEKSKKLLKNSQEPICVISEKIGFINYTYFYKLFKKKCNVTPAVYRKQQKDM